VTSVANDAAPSRLDQAGRWCTRLADGGLPPDERAQFDAWLAEDPKNEMMFEQVARVWDSVSDAAAAPEVIALRTEALEAFRAANNRRWSTNDRWPLKWVAGVAAALLAVMLPAGLWYSTWPTVYETGIGERQLAVLKDGSKVSLDADTELQVKLRDDRRDVVLTQGRAKFDVAKDALRPFRVQVGDKIVVATGTSFSVELLNGTAHVVLYEGRVSVVSTGRPAAVANSSAPAPIAPEVDLTPGKELVASLAGPQQKVVQADLDRSLSWEGGQLSFDDEPLEAAAERVNRYSNKKIKLADASVGELKVNGVYNAGDVDAFAVGINAVLPVRISDRGNSILVSRR
jgi:transmembrane sensor